METTYDVTIWNIERRQHKTRTTYRVVWWAAGKRHPRTFGTTALADSFRSDLVAAARRGEAFDIGTGLPVSMLREDSDVPWFELACRYVDMKWPRAAGKSRAGIADALASATPAMLRPVPGAPDPKVLRRALTGWAFNKKRREDDKPAEVARALKWLSRNTMSVSVLSDTAKLRELLDQMSLKMDGKQAAAKTVTRKRAVIYNFLDYAVEQKALSVNKLGEVKWAAPKVVRSIDKRVVINHDQAKALLRAVGEQWVEGQPRRSAGPMLVAYFAVMYYAALRPEEAVNLHNADLNLPEEGWGELLVSQTAPITGAAWTDSGKRRDERQLKQRGAGEVRTVPCAPPLTRLLHAHLRRFGTAADGRLFRNLTGGEVSESTAGRVWDKARNAALTPTEYASPLAKRPYDLRHACVSTWLAGGVPSTQCAEWAGHSVAVLHQIYAKVIAGLEGQTLYRIERVLGLGDDPSNQGDKERPSTR